MSKKRGGFSSLSQQIHSKLKNRGKEGALLCVLLATAAGIAMMFLLMCLFAAALSSFPAPLSIFQPAGLLIGAMASAAAGFVCALISREKGFFLGMACGFLLFLILMLTAILSWQQKIGTYSFVKLFTMLLCGAVGGSVGVNVK